VKDFAKKIRQEDARIAFKRQKIAKARATAVTAMNPPSTTNNTPAIVVSTAISGQPESHAARSEDPSSTFAMPRPAPGQITSPPSLHPSLPPKPGTPLKPLQSVQPVQEPKNIMPPSNASQLANVRVSTPVPPAAAPVDPEIAKYEEVSEYDCYLQYLILTWSEQAKMGMASASWSS
jgi:THO complex subunit 1